MKSWSQMAAGFGSAVLAGIAVVCVASRLPAVAAQNTAVAAAGFIMPGGAAHAIQSAFLEEDEEDNAPEASQPQPPASTPVSSGPAETQSSAVSAPQSSAAPASSQSGGSSGSTGPESGSIREISMENSGDHYNNIWVKNSNKNHTVDIASELKKAPAIKIKKNSAPQVLIYHTHTTEAYLGDTRSTDLNKTVVQVGNEIADQLRAEGINVVHDLTVHDYPSYNGSYDRSKVTIANDLKKYPEIQVTLDIHRDAMGTADGAHIKPTAVVGGKKAAQVMIISGCDDDGSLGFPNWEYNLRLAVRLQKAMSDLYPGLARPLNFCDRKYNENMTKGSLLVEFGTEVNTLDEARYSGQMFGKALADTLSQLT